MSYAEELVTAIEAYCRTLSENDKEGWLSLWTDDAVIEDPVGVDTYEGKPSIGTTFWNLMEQLSPMKLWLERDVIVCGNEAIAIINGVVSRDGQLTNVGSVVDHFVFNPQGKIIRMRAFW